MPFIGNQPALAYTSFAVQHFTTSATTSYTLDYPVANENEIRLVINNVVQQPGSSYAYTASGTSLTLSAATTVSDTMYAVFLGKAVQTVNPPNGSVGASQISDGSISLSKLSATGTKNSTTFLRGDNTFSTISVGITEADQWRLTTDFSSDAEITSNLERVDTYGFGLLGTGMTQSSGVFTFPSTGYWLVMAQGTIFSNQYGNTMLSILVTTDNSTYNYSNQIRQGNANYGVSNEPNSTGSGFSVIDVTSTTNVKVKFRTNSFGSGSILRGDTNTNVTSFMFIKLGDT